MAPPIVERYRGEIQRSAVMERRFLAKSSMPDTHLALPGPAGSQYPVTDPLAMRCPLSGIAR
ncbi:MAG: hypothetical protein ACI87O_000668 [Planctomycetota bacterium]|jgi:hypothetical protein